MESEATTLTDESTESPRPASLACKWCADPKITRKFLSDDAGCTVDAAANGEDGVYTLSHAWDDAWWPCLASGKQVKIFIGSNYSDDAMTLYRALENLYGDLYLVGLAEISLKSVYEGSARDAIRILKKLQRFREKDARLAIGQASTVA